MRVGLAVCLVWAGCLEATTTTPCGDVECAGDAECRGEGSGARCVPGELLRACDGKAEAEACTFAGTAGTCRAGECVTARCGNGFVDGDDECDGGAGCSATCRAIVCGNARIDAGEQCDCGDAAFAGTRPDECGATANADDATAYCRADCGRLVFCGNGFVEAGEVCDPSAGAGPCGPLCDSDLSCGNGVTDFAAGEACDCGTNAAALPGGCTQVNGASPDACRADCALPTCGDGVVDAGEICDDAGAVGGGDTCNALCTSDLSCGNGVLDPGEECDDLLATCQRLNCTVRRCGNDVVEADLGEVCDDDNNASGDGCSADCRSDETCGNGRLDFVLGQVDEACDDGNRVSHDGCSSVCNTEIPSWTLREVGVPAPREFPAMAYDAARQRTVLFGGKHQLTHFDDTWEWYGEAWARMPAAEAPPARWRHAMAYDAGRRRVVLFGGLRAPTGDPEESLQLDDTWTWDGVSWRQLLGAAPSPRARPAMAYDPVRRQVVLFGGEGATGLLRDTWLLGADDDWVQMPPTTLGPSARAGAAAAYLPALDRVLLFGGGGNEFSTQFSNDLWGWNGTSWAQLEPGGLSLPGRPSARTTVMATDLRRGEVVLVTGAYDGAVDGITYVFDGTSWEAITPALPPPARYGHATAYDVARDQLLIFGGREYYNSTSYPPQTWAWRGATRTWQEALPRHPFPRSGAGLAWDPTRGRVLLHAGLGASFYSDTWEWTGGGWSLVQSESPNDEFSNVAMTYVPALGKVVALGGFFDRYASTWDGVAWTPDPSRTNPPYFGAPLCADRTGGHALLYGGQPAFTLDVNPDVFALDGSGWSNLGGLTPARLNHTCFNDPVTGEVVLFGGNGELMPAEFGLLRDTVRLLSDRSGYEPLNASPRPGARQGAAAATDLAARRGILFGGFDGNALGDTWAWNGTAWAPVPVAQAPPVTTSPQAAYDGQSGHIVLLAAGDSTWTFAFRSDDPEEACRSGLDYDGDGAIGCADPDCWAVCAPTCDPHTYAAGGCTTGARCGDGTCSLVEDCRACPGDCGACTAVCGDFACDPPEDAAACPADCP